MFQLHFNNQTFREKDDFGAKETDLPSFAKAAISFCEAWLAGEKIFPQHTSGSTGIPKKIELKRSQLIASAQATGAFFGTDSTTKLLCCLNPEYIAGKMMLVRAMVWDCPLWLVEPKSNPLKDLPDALSPDLIAMVPLQVEECLRSERSRLRLQQVQHVIIGGAPMSQKQQKTLLEAGISAWQTYGMTETVSHIALAAIGSEKLEYRLLPDVAIGQDDRGALWITSPMSGPEKIQTNDLVQILSETSFHWLGRADFVINSGGIKLHPELLEHQAEPWIEAYFPGCRYFFFGEKDERWGESLTLFLEKENGSAEMAKLLQAKLKAEFGAHQSPKKVYFIPSFVQTPSGKINRVLTSRSL